MPNTYFEFKQFTIHQDRCAMKVTTDACLFGAWVAERLRIRPARTLLDIGTGSGLLSLMIAQKTTLLIDGIELEPGACAQAAGNAAASPWKDRIQIVQGDALTYPFARNYDVIVSNPPFYEDELRSSKGAKNLAHHDEGLRLEELVELIAGRLAPAGKFFLLLPYKRNAVIRELFKHNALEITELCLVRPRNETAYFRIMCSGKQRGAIPMETSMEELVIHAEGQEYSTGFKRLLKDYYLHL